MPPGLDGLGDELPPLEVEPLDEERSEEDELPESVLLEGGCVLDDPPSLVGRGELLCVGLAEVPLDEPLEVPVGRVGRTEEFPSDDGFLVLSTVLVGVDPPAPSGLAGLEFGGNVMLPLPVLSPLLALS